MSVEQERGAMKALVLEKLKYKDVPERKAVLHALPHSG